MLCLEAKHTMFGWVKNPLPFFVELMKLPEIASGSFLSKIALCYYLREIYWLLFCSPGSGRQP